MTQASDTIATAHALYRAHLARQDEVGRTHWLACVAAGTAGGEYPGMRCELPVTMGSGQIVEYIGIAYPILARNKTALRRAIKSACADGSIRFARKDKFSVGYGDGRHSASGFQATRPISYDRFDRESVDTWAAKQ